jgi:hypothetical protein
MSSLPECCICFEELNPKINNCVTQCGHIFCFACIAKSLGQNNTCPCCRAVLAETVESDDEDASFWSETDYDDVNEEAYTDYALQGSRWLFQREEDGEIDPTEEDEEELSIDEDEYEDNITETEDTDEPLAEVEEITAKLQQRGITMIDIIAMMLERKSKNVRKHNPGFFAALDVMIHDITNECDMDAKSRIVPEAEPSELAETV